MVYVVAAYSITIGVLLIYGVLLQHRARLAGARKGGGFNLGAALLAPVWALFHGQPAAGATLLATAAALAAAQASGLALAASLLAALFAGASLFLGVVGNRIASAGSRAGGVDGTGGEPVARAQAELRWALAGAVLHTVVLPWACYFWLAGR
ncbi:MAG: hypothetical protein IPK00_14540 [Deltaproteobacteria bacterium]|nr:hypothetical protein [Deltaproteobacteria bacterium]